MTDVSVEELRAALAFIAHVRGDPAARARIAALGPLATLDDAAAMAAELGHPITADCLRRAHRHDWMLRRARYSAGGDVAAAAVASAQRAVAEVNSPSSST